MIPNQTIGSPRAEKQKATTLLVVCGLWTALMTSTLAIWSQAAWGSDSHSRVEAKTADAMRLPPIQYLESTPWLRWSLSSPTLKIDTLMTPAVTPEGVVQTPGNRAQGRPAPS